MRKLTVMRDPRLATFSFKSPKCRGHNRNSKQQPTTVSQGVGMSWQHCCQASRRGARLHPPPRTEAAGSQSAERG
jgi:hypothetical protein